MQEQLKKYHKLSYADVDNTKVVSIQGFLLTLLKLTWTGTASRYLSSSSLMASKQHHQHQRLRNLKAPVDWELLEKIGDGTFGSVFKVKSTRSGQLAAVKVMYNINEKHHDETLAELDILKKFSNHANIVQFLGAYKYKSKTQAGDQLWLVMEVGEKRKQNSVMRYKDIKIFRSGICKGS